MGVHSPYFRWFPKDYKSDTKVGAMTDDQDLAYRRMLDASWEDGPLPSKLDELAMIVRYTPERFRKAWSYPLVLCWQENGHGTLINQRLEDERESMMKRSEKARKAVRIREKRRRARLNKKAKSKAETRSSNDNPAVIVPASIQSHSHNKATTSQKKQGSKRKRSFNPEDRIDFVRGTSGKESKFEGPGVDRVKVALRTEYQEEFGDGWLWATWLDAVAHGFQNEGWAEEKKSLRMTILNWFRREAKKKRERQQNV